MLRAPSTPTFVTEDEGYQPQSTTGEVIGASFESAYRQTTVMSLARSAAIEFQMQEGPLLDPEQINAKYNINAKTPMTERAAIVIQGEQQEVNRLNSIIENGPKSFWGGTLPGFLGAIAGGMSDPVDMTAGILMGGAAKGLATGVKAAQTMTTGKAAIEGLKWAKLGAGSEVAIGARASFVADSIGNIMSNGFTEAFNYNATKKEQMEMAVDEVFKNVVATSLMFTGVMHGTGAVLSKIGKIGDNAVQHLHNMAEAGVLSGTRIDKAIGRPIAIMEKDLEFDASFKDSVANIFPEKAGDWLKEGNDVITVRDKIKSDPTITPAKFDEFVAELENNGYEMRKLYLFEEDANPRMSVEDIAKMQEDLRDPKNAEWYDGEADEISKSMDNRDLEVEDINLAQYDEPLKRLAKYDIDVNDLETKTGAKFDELRRADEIAVKRKTEFDTYEKSLKDFTACVLGTMA
jgi:hypothetical protein